MRKRDDQVRVYSRRGADWTHRFPLIVQAASRLKAMSLYLDGEEVVCGKDGVALFDKLHSKANDDAVFLYAFDILELDGIDLRPTPLPYRKKQLRSLLRNRRSGIVFKQKLTT